MYNTVDVSEGVGEAEDVGEAVDVGEDVGGAWVNI